MIIKDISHFNVNYQYTVVYALNKLMFFKNFCEKI